MLDKKGVSMEDVGKIIVALLFVFFTGFGNFLYGTGNKEACQNWVYRKFIEIASLT